MANISQIVTLNYVMTAADKLAGIVSVPVLWRTPFNDTNYVLSFTVEATSTQHPTAGLPEGSIWNSGLTDITRNGFTAVVTLESSVVTAGDVIRIQAMASHR